jgi:hypothetical protein
MPDGYYNDAMDRVVEVRDARATVWRWREAFQNDFAARMDWCVADDPRSANHNPVAVLNSDRTRQIVRLQVESGSSVRLSAGGSSDPDGNQFSYRWFDYPEPGGSKSALDLRGSTGESLIFKAPEVSSATDLHIVLEMKDNGTPALYAYRRAVVSVLPRAARRAAPKGPYPAER